MEENLIRDIPQGNVGVTRYKISPDYYKYNIAPHLEKLMCKNSKKKYV